MAFAESKCDTRNRDPIKHKFDSSCTMILDLLAVAWNSQVVGVSEGRLGGIRRRRVATYRKNLAPQPQSPGQATTC